MSTIRLEILSVREAGDNGIIPANYMNVGDGTGRSIGTIRPFGNKGYLCRPVGAYDFVADTLSEAVLELKKAAG